MKRLSNVAGLAVLALAVHCASDDTAFTDTSGAPDASPSPSHDSGPPAVPDDATTLVDAAPDAPPLLPPQDAGALCTQDAECLSGGCDDTNHCAIGRSCTQQNGGRTCGPDADQNCCSTAVVPKPGGAFVLDTYSITAGRFRAFVDKTGGDVRGYVQQNRPDWFDEAWLAWLPNVMDDGTVVKGPGGHAFVAGAGQDGVYQQLGPIHYGIEGGGNEGCLTSQVGNARTYRLPDAVNDSLFGDVQEYPQDILDQKPMQCTTFYMFAAFCIWDGGRIPTLEELDYAWDGGDPDGHLYPWGNTPAPGGWDHPYPYMPDGFGEHAPAGSNITFANYKYNFWMPAQIICLDGDENKCDYSLYLAPPGRFPKGNGPFGHADLAGDVYNVAMPPDDPDAGSDPATLKAGLERTGAFDNHAIPKARPVAGFRTYTATNKYLAVGGRCAR